MGLFLKFESFWNFYWLILFCFSFCFLFFLCIFLDSSEWHFNLACCRAAVLSRWARWSDGGQWGGAIPGISPFPTPIPS